MTDPKTSRSTESKAAESILEIGRRCAALPDRDTRTDDQILGYNKFGAFRGSMTTGEAADLRARVKRIRKSSR